MKEVIYKEIMKSFICTLLLMLCVLGQNALAADFSKLIILHTNDSHGYAVQSKGHVGMAALAQYKQDLLKQGYDVILLDAGDCTQGNILVNSNQGQAAVDYMNAVGYDAGCLGNHEFDYGQELLRKRIRDWNHKALSCNVFYTATGKPFTMTSTILKRASGKIGVVGMTTPNTVISSRPVNVEGLTFKAKEELYKSVQKEIDKLKEAKCDLIVGVGHLGSELDCMGSRSEDVINNTKGLDIFVDGHDHTLKNDYINGVLRAEVGFAMAAVGKISYDGNKWVEKHVAAYDYQSPRVNRVLKKYNEELEKRMAVPLAVAPEKLSNDEAPGLRTQEMGLGNLVADAFLWQANEEYGKNAPVDFAIVGGGIMKRPMPKGTITRGDVCNSLVFNNYMHIYKVKGKVLLEALETACSYNPDPTAGFPQVAGLEFDLYSSVPYVKGEKYPKSRHYAPAAPGNRVRIRSIGGKAFDPEKEYLGIGNEVMVAGGDAYAAFENKVQVVYQLQYRDQAILEKYMVEKLGGKIPESYYKPAGRIVIK